jgi:TrmH family RNA methyltransferase
MAAAADLAHPPRVIGVFDSWERPAPDPSVPGVRLVLNAVHDPGNAGTAIRSAAAFGAVAVGLTPGSADAFSPKTLRAAMGTTFLLSVSKVKAPASFPGCGPLIVLDGRGDVLLPELNDAITLWESNHPSASSISAASPILVIGSEREGVHESFMNAADLIVRIPQAPEVESVNAGVAATVAMYELARGT